MGKSSLSVGMKAWIDKINGAWRASAASVVDCGRFLLECKANVPPGDFQRMVKSQLDFSPSMARKFMAIAGDQRLLQRAHGNALPKHWTTLYELHQLADDDLDRVLTDAKPAKREDIKQLRAPKATDITPSADEAGAPADTHQHQVAVPGSAVPEGSDREHHDAVDDREVGDSGHQMEVAAGVLSMLDREASVFDNEPGSPSTVAVEMDNLTQDIFERALTAAIYHSKLISIDRFFADLTIRFEHEDVNFFANWILDFEELVKVAKQTEEAEAAV